MCYQQISVFRPIGTPWHVFFHRGCDIGDTWKYGQAWPNSGDSKVHFAHCGCNYCICRFGWSQLISSTSCDVQIWIAVSKMSFRSCSVAKSEMYHRRFWVRPALGLTWSIFAYNDTKLQPLPPTSKDTNGKQRKERIRPKKTYINWPTPNQSDQLMAFRNQANASAKVPGTVSEAGSCVGSSMTGSTGAECAKSFVCSSKSGYLGGSLEVCPLRALGKQVEIRRNYCVKNKWTTGKPNIFCEQILHRSS
jgi:hypothetical protein